MNYTLFCRSFRNVLSLCRVQNNVKKISFTRNIQLGVVNFDTSNLMQFFDDKKNWGENNIKLGRSWKLDELRIKSNTDLHKLWYVLLKERNMLYTMEHECNDKMELFPNPERIDKVQDSMNNIETIVRERNVAYYKLETGETGERPMSEIVNLIGLNEKYLPKEYAEPKIANTKWVKPYLEHGYVTSRAVRKFLLLFKEKQYNEKRIANNRDFRHVQKLIKRFPDIDLEKLKMEYPNVDMEKALRPTKKIRGHCMPKY